MKRTYEELMKKSILCLEAARKTEGWMRKLWLRKSEILKEKALDLSVN